MQAVEKLQLKKDQVEKRIQVTVLFNTLLTQLCVIEKYFRFKQLGLFQKNQDTYMRSCKYLILIPNYLLKSHHGSFQGWAMNEAEGKGQEERPVIYSIHFT